VDATAIATKAIRTIRAGVALTFKPKIVNAIGYILLKKLK
jgi:hypothetical protein